MRVRREHLEWSVRLIGRSLMMPSPDYANSAFILSATIQSLEKKEEQAAEQWFKIERMTYDGKLQRGYIRVAGHKAGQYVRELPAGVNPKTVIPFKTDWTIQPVTDMARGQSELTAALLADPKRVLGLEDEFIATDADKKRIAALLPVLEGMIEASRPKQDEQCVAASKQRVFQALQPAVSEKDLRPALSELSKLADESEEKWRRFASPCTVAGWFLAYRDICTAIERRLRKIERDQTATIAKTVRFIAFGCAPGISHPAILTMGLASNCARAGLSDVVEKIAEKYRSKGGSLVSAALDAKSVDEHDRLLYDAGLLLYVANRLYSGMAEDPPTGLPSATRSKYAKFSEVAEESQVRISAALLHSVRNRTGALFRAHRTRIAEARKKRGEKGVEEELFDLIERQYLYPRCYKKLLTDARTPDPWEIWLKGGSKRPQPP